MLTSRAPSLIYKKSNYGYTPLDLVKLFHDVFKSLLNGKSTDVPSVLQERITGSARFEENGYGKFFPQVNLLIYAYSEEKGNLHIARLNSEQKNELENVYNNYARSLAIMLEYVLRDLYQALSHVSMHIQ